MKYLALVLFAIVSFSSFAKLKVDKIKVYKQERLMRAYYKDELVREYRIALSISHNIPGFRMGPKRLRGDMRTPEGSYKIIKKRQRTQYPLSLLINYPNKKDLAWGKKNGKTEWELGDMILIHGFPYRPTKVVRDFVTKIGADVETVDEWLRAYFYPYFDWTSGCIGITDEQMKELFEAVEVGTKIEIKSFLYFDRSKLPDHLEAYPIRYY